MIEKKQDLWGKKMEAPRMRITFAEKIHLLRDWFRHVIDHLDGIIRVVLWIGISLIMFTVVFHVVGRYFFGKTYMGSMELVRYTTIWVSLLGASVAFGSGEHVGITSLQNALSKQSWFWISILGNLLLCVFLVAMAIGGVEITLRNLHQTSLGLQIPMFYPYLAIPVGALFMLLYVLLNILNSIISKIPSLQQLSNAQKGGKK
ncbi:MAG: TRAP transporter small permease [Thermodesulfobacteriota bacterium]|nr:TRAP transporter small permease [Thermodesulfobacteriota bacterium]